MDNNQPRPMDFVFVLMAIVAFIALVAMLGGNGGGNTYNGPVNTQYNVGAVVNNGVVGANTSTLQQIAPTPAPMWSTDNAGNAMCWSQYSQQYVYSPCPQGVQP